MRTTITFEADTAAAIDQVRRERGVGISQAVNELVRRGLSVVEPPRPFAQRTSAGRARIDVTDVAETLDLLDSPVAP